MFLWKRNNEPNMHERRASWQICNYHVDYLLVGEVGLFQQPNSHNFQFGKPG
jgi:hypothetical protein